MARATNEHGVCSECCKEIDLVARKCPWCHSRLELAVTSEQLQNAVSLSKFFFRSSMIGIFLGAFLIWYWWGGDRNFKKGEIEGVVHLYPSELYVGSQKRNIKEIIFKKTYEFESSSDKVAFAKNAYPVRSKCFKEVFTVSYQKFQKYYDSVGEADNNGIKRLINEKAIINKKNGKEEVNWDSWNNLNRSHKEYDWEFYNYIPYNQLTKYPNIRIYCRYKDAIHKNLR